MKEELTDAVLCISNGNVTKKTIAEMSSKIVSNVVDDGQIDPLLAFTQIKAMQAVLDDCVKKLSEPVLNVAEKYGTKSFSQYGVDFQVREVGVKYDFSDDATWNAMQETKKGLDAEIKGRETALKLAGNCAKSSTTAVVVNFRKE